MRKLQLATRKTGALRACLVKLQLVLVVLGSLLCSATAQAYPWMLKHGYPNCAACHSDPSGGELLTGYGRVLSQEALSTQCRSPQVSRTNAGRAGDAAPPDAGAAEPEAAEPPRGPEGHEFFQPFFGAIALPDTLLLGGSVRVATLYEKGSPVRVFPMQFDLSGDYKFLGRLHLGGSLGLAKVPIGKPEARAAQITRDQGDGWNLISRTHYLRYEFGEGAFSVSAGRLNLPFGIRMSEHTLWVRQKTATDRESAQEDGAALNMNFDDWRFEVMGIAGNYQVNPDQFRKRGYSGYLEVSPWDGGAVGVSSLITHAASDALNPGHIADTRQAHGAFLRAALGHELVLLAEGDLLLHTQTKPGYVGFSQLDFEPTRGVHVFGTAEVLDLGFPKNADEHVTPRIAGAGKPQLGGWLSAQWFFVAHFDFRVDAIIRQAEPFQLLSQIHVYL